MLFAPDNSKIQQAHYGRSCPASQLEELNQPEATLFWTGKASLRRDSSGQVRQGGKPEAKLRLYEGGNVEARLDVASLACR